MRELILSLAFSLSAGCIPPLPTDATPPSQITLTGARLQSFRGSVLVTTGRAAQVTYQRTNGDMIGSEVLLRFPSQGGEGPKGIFTNLEVRAPTMVGNLGTKQADGMEGVVAKSSEGWVGRTQRAHFDGVQMVASGKDAITVDRPGHHLEATGFSMHLKEETAEFGGPVSSQIGGK